MGMIIDKETCTEIQCGANDTAGMDVIMACSTLGYSGVRSCQDPVCSGSAMPSYCAPSALNPAVSVQPIPFSPANTPSGDQIPLDIDMARSKRNIETKRRRSFYQEQVQCPGGETNPFWMGMNTWKSLDSVMNTIPVVTDLGLEELAGFLLPALVIGFVGYRYLNKGF